MITITKAAAEQIKHSAEQSKAQGMPLRIACQRNDNGSLQYALGFADVEHDQDLHFSSEGIDIVVAPTSFDLVNTMEIDFVALDNGQNDFIFKNPNDPNYIPAK